VGIALILIFGTRMIPFMFIAPIADLAIRPFPLPLAIELWTAVLTGGVYAAGGCSSCAPGCASIGRCDRCAISCFW
jgi:hypothetical protein